MHDKLIIRGAREHNLKNINLEIPRDKLVTITGLSGSGKSSLAFDTIYAEGQRRYVESLSAYARQFLGLMEKPDVDQIEGLSPAISIDQKSTSRNPRSTVATVTEIYDYLRLLFARIGVPPDPKTGEVLTRQTPAQIIEAIEAHPQGTRIVIMAPVVKGKKGEHRHVLAELQRAGYLRARIDGDLVDLDEITELEKQKKPVGRADQSRNAHGPDEEPAVDQAAGDQHGDDARTDARKARQGGMEGRRLSRVTPTDPGQPEKEHQGADPHGGRREVGDVGHQVQAPARTLRGRAMTHPGHARRCDGAER